MSLADYAVHEGLHKVGGRPPFWAYLRDVWRHRPFIYRLAKFRIESENGRNRLGMGWVILKPTINAAVYGTVFGVLLGSKARPDNYLLFLVIGVFFFHYFTDCFSSGAKSITRNANLVQSLSFPRMSLPLALVTQRLLQFIPIVGLILILVLVSGFRPRLEWLELIPLIALFTIFNAGLTMITARLTVHLRDLTQLLPFVSRLLFYTSGVFFSIDKRFQGHDTFLYYAGFQPIHEFMSLARGALLVGPDHVVPSAYWVYATVWSLVVIVVGSIFFWAAEERYGRVD
jgi:teichoic acid transport system permease protein